MDVFNSQLPKLLAFWAAEIDDSLGLVLIHA